MKKEKRVVENKDINIITLYKLLIAKYSLQDIHHSSQRSSAFFIPLTDT